MGLEKRSSVPHLIVALPNWPVLLRELGGADHALLGHVCHECSVLEELGECEAAAALCRGAVKLGKNPVGWIDIAVPPGCVVKSGESDLWGGPSKSVVTQDLVPEYEPVCCVMEDGFFEVGEESVGIGE